MKFVQIECNLLKIFYFVKKIILNINFIKVIDARGKINENQKMVLRKKNARTRPCAKALAKMFPFGITSLILINL